MTTAAQRAWADERRRIRDADRRLHVAPPKSVDELAGGKGWRCHGCHEPIPTDGGLLIVAVPPADPDAARFSHRLYAAGHDGCRPPAPPADPAG